MQDTEYPDQTAAAAADFDHEGAVKRYLAMLDAGIEWCCSKHRYDRHVAHRGGASD